MKAGPTTFTRVFIGRVLKRCVLREASYAVLRCDVRDRASEFDRAQDRPHVHDRPPTRRLHRGDLLAHSVEDPREVDRDDLVPPIDRILAHWRGRAAEKCMGRAIASARWAVIHRLQQRP